MNKIEKIAIFLFLLVLFFSSNTPTNVVATDDDDDGIDDSYEIETHRNVTVDLDDDEKIEFESILGTGAIKDEFEFEIRNKTGDPIRAKFEYAKVNGSVEKDEEELEFSIRFENITEYTDLNGDGVFSTGDQIHGSSYEIGNAGYNTTYSLNNDIHRVIVNTTDGIFTANFYITENFEKINGTLVTPFEVKIDIEINWPTYLGGSNSLLALCIKVEVEFEICN